MARPLLCDRPIDSSALPAELLWLPGEILDPDVDEGRAPKFIASSRVLPSSGYDELGAARGIEALPLSPS